MFRNLSIKNKLTLIITAVTATTLILGFAGITLSYYNETRTKFIEGVEKEAQLVASYSQVPVALDFHDDLRRILNEVTILDAYTSAICDLDPGALIQVDKGGGQIGGASDCQAKDDVWQDQWLWVTQPVFDVEGQKLADVVFKVSTEGFYRNVQVFATWTLVITCISIAFSFFMARRLQVYISRPIMDLEAATKQLCNREDYELRVPVTSQDEIGSLSLSFNQMLEAMEQRQLERNNALEEMHVLANYDGLTGQPNRSLCLDRLKHAITQAERRANRAAIMFIDLDNFKDVNDHLGHNVGDSLLVEVSECLRKCLRQSDTLARLGGDEFVVILTDFISKTDLAGVAEKCVTAVGQDFSIGENVITTTASIGIAIFPDDATSIDELLKAADSAMYQAKDRGKNSYSFYEQKINSIIARRHTLSNELRQALKGKQLHVEYQPVVDLHSNKIVGAEALVRWQHPQHGAISPAEFIPIAESCGLVLQISLFVIESVCKFIARTQDQLGDDFSVAINLSPVILRHSKLLDQIKDFLEQYKVPAKAICFEVTENTLMNEMEHCIQRLNALKKLGSKVSIDDFGTGYSSLSYLSKLPVDNLKIDRSFISNMLHDNNDKAITLAIISLAQSLQLKVIAEGVEEQAQLLFLKNSQCEYIQGFLVSASRTDDAFMKFLKNYNQLSAAD